MSCLLHKHDVVGPERDLANQTSLYLMCPIQQGSNLKKRLTIAEINAPPTGSHMRQRASIQKKQARRSQQLSQDGMAFRHRTLATERDTSAR